MVIPLSPAESKHVALQATRRYEPAHQLNGHCRLSSELVLWVIPSTSVRSKQQGGARMLRATSRTEKRRTLALRLYSRSPPVLPLLPHPSNLRPHSDSVRTPRSRPSRAQRRHSGKRNMARALICRTDERDRSDCAGTRARLGRHAIRLCDRPTVRGRVSYACPSMGHAETQGLGGGWGSGRGGEGQEHEPGGATRCVQQPAVGEPAGDEQDLGAAAPARVELERGHECERRVGDVGAVGGGREHGEHVAVVC